MKELTQQEIDAAFVDMTGVMTEGQRCFSHADRPAVAIGIHGPCELALCLPDMEIYQTIVDLCRRLMVHASETPDLFAAALVRVNTGKPDLLCPICGHNLMEYLGSVSVRPLKETS